MVGVEKLKMNKGFTLVEMLTTVLVFSIVVGTTTGIFVSAVRVQRYTLATQELLDQTSYALEYMNRFLRMARKDDIRGSSCLVGTKVNYENPIVLPDPQPDTTRIKFLNYKGECQEFFRDWNAVDGVYQLTVKEKIGTAAEASFALTSEKFDVTFLEFAITGEEQAPADTNQPRVTISLEIEAKSSFLQPRPKIRVQTTISQRDLDLEE